PVRCTQVSGSSEIRQSRDRMRCPRQRPSAYQAKSVARCATNAPPITPAIENLPEPASTPAARSTGADGTGSPSPLAKRRPKTTQSPRAAISLSTPDMMPQIPEDRERCSQPPCAGESEPSAGHRKPHHEDP